MGPNAGPNFENAGPYSLQLNGSDVPDIVDPGEQHPHQPGHDLSMGSRWIITRTTTPTPGRIVPTRNTRSTTAIGWTRSASVCATRITTRRRARPDIAGGRSARTGPADLRSSVSRTCPSSSRTTTTGSTVAPRRAAFLFPDTSEFRNYQTWANQVVAVSTAPGVNNGLLSVGAVGWRLLHEIPRERRTRRQSAESADDRGVYAAFLQARQVGMATSACVSCAPRQPDRASWYSRAATSVPARLRTTCCSRTAHRPPTSGDNEYDNVLPSFNLRYKADGQLLPEIRSREGNRASGIPAAAAVDHHQRRRWVSSRVELRAAAA